MTASCLTVQWCLFLGCRSKQWSIIACCVTVQSCLWVACSCVKLCCSDGILYKDMLASVKTLSCVMRLFQNLLRALIAMAPFRHLWLHYKWTIWFMLERKKKGGAWAVNSVIVYVPYLNHNQAIYCMLNVSLCINSLYFCICLLINSLLKRLPLFIYLMIYWE